MLRKERNDLYKNTFSCDQTGFLQEAGFLKQIVIKHYIFFFRKMPKIPLIQVPFKQQQTLNF